jgi:hypothetical protein
MSCLKFLHRDQEDSAPLPQHGTTECPHSVLIPHWDNVADMGKTERADSFRCDACHREFTPGEAAALRATEGERLRRLVS